MLQSLLQRLSKDEILINAGIPDVRIPFSWLKLIVSLDDCVKFYLKSLKRLCLNPKIRLGSESKLVLCVLFVCLFFMLF